MAKTRNRMKTHPALQYCDFSARNSEEIAKLTTASASKQTDAVTSREKDCRARQKIDRTERGN